ncbi:MAG: GvpL/GvpF family gas vesicle protein [Chloroflexota bacterium]
MRNKRARPAERCEGTGVSEGLYVYCVIGTGEARNFGPIGVGGRGDAVTTIAYTDLSAVVSSLPMDKYVVAHETMLCHERVLEAVMADHTVLPVRFYTIAPNAEEIRGLLRTRYAEFKRLLRELDNKVELGIKALWKNMNQVLSELVQNDSKEQLSGWEPNPQPGNATAGLDKRLRPALDEERTRTSEVLLAPLRPFAFDVRLNRTYGDDMIMNAAFLVDRSREREFDARVGQLSAQHTDTIEFKYVGPAPPYSFVNIVIKEEVSPGAPPRGRD